ncbi:MAG: GDSL-type esterase/lipase family protein [Pseudomonadota bacterium]|nr:GDSL-type esterase/lipase family protein [Pseudomonadota bacterium]
MTRRAPRAAVTVLAYAGALLVALAGLEGWERTAAWPVADSWYRVDEADGEVRFRCQDYAPVSFGEAPATGVTRIVVLGGSTAFGYPERPAGTTPIPATRHGVAGILQASLDAEWPGRFEIVNLGVNGGSSDDTRRLARRALAWGPTAFVVYDGHNEYMAAPARFSPSLWRFALYRHVMVLGARVDRAPGWVGPSSIGGPANADAVVALFRANLSALAALADGIPVVIATQAGNLAGLDPSWSTSGDHLAGLDQRPDDEIDQRWAASPAVADLAWQAGRRALAAGGDALPALHAAVDHDGMPFRATSAINDAIRTAAASHGFTLVDAEAAVYAAGPPDGTLFYDNVHPRPDAAGLLARALLDGLARAGVLPGAPPVTAAPVPPSDEAIRRTAGYWLRWACIRGHDPGWRLARARSWAQLLLARAPGNPDATAMLALADELGGGTPAVIPKDPALRTRLAAIHPRIATVLARAP